jgi:hypothetical protein
MKTGLIAAVAAVAVVVGALMLGAYQSRSEHQCFYLDRELDAKICYVRKPSSSNASQMKQVYEQFVLAVAEGDSALAEVVRFGDALRAGYGDRAFGEIRAAYAWAKPESLRHVVEDEEGGAILLERAPDNLYALYFDASTSRIFFSFDTEEKYLPIDSGWINLKYDGRLEVASHYPWQEAAEGPCVFSKGHVFLSTPAMGEQDGVPYCDYGPYRLLRLESRNRVARRPEDEALENRGVLDDTMQFMRWIAN